MGPPAARVNVVSTTRDSWASPNCVPRPGRFAGSGLGAEREASAAPAALGAEGVAGAPREELTPAELSASVAAGGGAGILRRGGGGGCQVTAGLGRSRKNATPMTPTFRSSPWRPAYESRTDENRKAATASSDVRHPSMTTSP